MQQLSIEEYANVALVSALFYALIPVAGFSLAPALARLLARESRVRQLGHNTVLITGYMVGLLTALVSWVIFLFFLPPLTKGPLLWGINIAALLGFLGAAYMQVKIGALLGGHAFGRVAVWEIAEAVGRVLVLIAILVVFARFEWVTFFCSIALGAPVAALLLRSGKLLSPWINKAQGLNPSQIINAIRELLPHAVSIVVVSFSSLIMAYWLRLFAKAGGVSEVAYFDSALVLYGLPRLIFASIVMPVNPIVAREGKQKGLIPSPLVCLLIILLPVPVGIIIGSTPIGEGIFLLMNIAQYSPAVIAFSILVGGSGADFLFGFCSSHLQGIGKSQVVAVICLVCLVVVTVCAWPLKEIGNALLASMILVFYFALIATCSWLYLFFSRGVEASK